MGIETMRMMMMSGVGEFSVIVARLMVPRPPALAGLPRALSKLHGTHKHDLFYGHTYVLKSHVLIKSHWVSSVYNTGCTSLTDLLKRESEVSSFFKNDSSVNNYVFADVAEHLHVIFSSRAYKLLKKDVTWKQYVADRLKYSRRYVDRVRACHNTIQVSAHSQVLDSKKDPFQTCGFVLFWCWAGWRASGTQGRRIHRAPNNSASLRGAQQLSRLCGCMEIDVSDSNVGRRRNHRRCWVCFLVFQPTKVATVAISDFFHTHKKNKKKNREVLTSNQRMQRIVFSTAMSEYYTPPTIIENVQRFLGGIDLDIASSEAANGLVKAKRFFTRKDNALNQEWTADRVWGNFPGGLGEAVGDGSVSVQGTFLQKAIDEFQAGNFVEGVFLVKFVPYANWFRVIFDEQLLFGIFKKRITFTSTKPEGILPSSNPSPHPYCLLFLGPSSRNTVFASCFKDLCFFAGLNMYTLSSKTST